MKHSYLPEAQGSSDFIILGSETGFWAMIFGGAALAIIAVCAIILFIKKSGK